MNYRIGQRIVVTEGGDSNEKWLHSFKRNQIVTIDRMDKSATQNIHAIDEDKFGQWLDVTQIRPCFNDYLDQIEKL